MSNLSSVPGSMLGATREPRGAAWRTFTEADQYAEAIAGAKLVVTPKQRANRPWALLPVALARGFVQFADEPCASLTYGHLARDIAGFGVALAASTGYRINGHPIAGNVFALLGPGATYFASTEAATRWAAVSFAPADLASAVAAMRGGGAASLSGVFRAMFAPQDVADNVVGLLFSAMLTLERDPAALSAASARASLEQALLDAFAKVVAAGTAPRNDRVKLPATRLVRQCEEYLESHLASPVYIADLCKLTGASERTLRNAFHAVYGVGPTRYLMQRRLANARRALREPKSGDTVTAVATRHGLWDLGRFAADYRTLYGEPPSATLRNARALAA